jgi:hypothetical protein
MAYTHGEHFRGREDNGGRHRDRPVMLIMSIRMSSPGIES